MSENPISENGLVLSDQTQNLPQMANAPAEMLDATQIQNIAKGLQDATVIDVNLATDYWSPTKVLEKKRVVFVEIKEQLTDDIADPTKKKLLPTAIFVENIDGTLKRISNASKKLVGILADSHVVQGTGLEITYLGKVKNKSNNYSSDSWAVKLLTINIS